MKTYLLQFCSIIGVFLSLSSCTTYQYVTVGSNLNSNDVGEYYIENDTVKIFFLFTGANGPVIIEVINKWDQPIYVNWKNSALIMNGTSYPLWSDIAELQINTAGATDYLEGTYFEASSNGSLTRKEHITFLPPQTSVINDQYRLASQAVDIPKSYPSNKFTLPNSQGQVSAKKYAFAADNTPLSFRLFLTYATDEQQKNRFNVDETFWISEIISTDVSPENFPKNPSNSFFISSPTKFATAATYIIGIPVLIGLAALGAE